MLLTAGGMIADELVLPIKGVPDLPYKLPSYVTLTVWAAAARGQASRAAATSTYSSARPSTGFSGLDISFVGLLDGGWRLGAGFEGRLPAGLRPSMRKLTTQ